MALRAGERLGPYEILGGLGAGGMGEVYRARDTRLGRSVAVKVLRSDAACDPDRLRRLEQEARAAGSLSHPNVLVLYDVGTHAGSPYLVTELLEGETLRQRLDGGALAVRKAVDYGLQVARGLAAAHEHGVVHRDLKPENLFLTKDGIVKILDFGLARLVRPEHDDGTGGTGTVTAATEPGAVLGTLGYMSPEQVRGESVDHRSDIFALGAVLYEMTTGRRAFQKDTSVETLNAILKDEPPELAADGRIPAALDRLVRHCLEKKPEDRFQSARDLAFELEGLDRVAPRAAVAHRPVGRWRLWASGAAVLLAVALLAYVAGRSGDPSSLPLYRQVTFGRGFTPSGRFTPDGRTVVYSAAWNGGPPEIYSVAIDSLESKPLGLPHGHVAAISSKGELAMLLTEQPVDLLTPATLARISLAGGVPRPIAEGVLCADWAPDAENVALSRRVGGRDQIEYPAGRVLAVDSTGCPRFSPDGARLAWAVADGYEVVELGSGRRRRLAGVPELGHEFWWSWSPDGREIWTTASHEGNERPLRAVSMDGAQRVVARVTGPFSLYDVSRDGRGLFEHGFAWWLVRTRAPGGVEREISVLDHTEARDVAADGQVLLLREWGGRGDTSVAHVWRARDGTTMRLARGMPCALSPDGWFALVLPDLQNVPLVARPSSLTIVPLGAGQPRVVPLAVRNPVYAVWLPDQQRVLVTTESGAERQRQVFVVGVEGKGLRAVTPSGVFAGLQWDVSPIPVTDGRQVAVPSPQGRLTLYRIDGPGEPRELAGLSAGWSATRFASDGRSLFVVGPESTPTRVHRVDLASGRRTLVYELSPEDRTGVTTYPEALVTPDGRGYAYTYRRIFHKLFVAEGLH
jgi:hypothetical protein